MVGAYGETEGIHMEISEKVETREVLDYEFSFIGGQRLLFSVDTVAGDYVRDDGDTMYINMVAKPFIDGEPMDAEEITVFKRNLAALAVRKRLQVQPTEEQLFDMRQLTLKLAKGTH